MGRFADRYDEIHPPFKENAKIQEVIQYFYHWRRRGGDNMAAQIFNLICKADNAHKESFYKGFPEYVVIWELWQESKTEKDFFISFGIKE